MPSIDSLRRRMVLARAQSILQRMSNDYCSEWHFALLDGRPLPSTHEFILRVAAAGFRLPSFTSVSKYLERCRENDTEPDPKALLKTLLPWTWRVPSTF